MKSIGVIGGGAWGTALAQVAAAGGETILWAREPEVVDGINRRHENGLFLSGIPLNHAIRATGELAELRRCDALLVVTPAQHTRAVLSATPLRQREQDMTCVAAYPKVSRMPVRVRRSSTDHPDGHLSGRRCPG